MRDSEAIVNPAAALEDGPDERATDSDDGPVGSKSARKCREQFMIMSVTVGINHAAVTTPIIFASSVLTNTAGQSSNAVLYGGCLVTSLFFSTLIFGLIGAKKGLALSMGLYTVYVLLFGMAASLCAEQSDKGACITGQAAQLPVVLVGAAVGGVGAGLLWTCQGGFFAAVSERLAIVEMRAPQEITAELAGTFAWIFLAAECAFRASATLLTRYAELDFAVVFYIYAACAGVSALAFAVLGADLRGNEPAQRAAACGKALGAVRLWLDPRLWLLQSTNIAFAFAAAWLGGYIGRNILSKALSSTFIGFAGATLSGLASLLSKALVPAAARAGKGPVVLLGSLAFLALGVLSKWVGDPVEWGWGTIAFYVFMGIGRAVYESTNKAIFADFFPGEKSAGAFANVFVFSTGASVVAYVLGTFQADLVENYLLLIFAAVTFPCFLLATLLRGAEKGGESSDSDSDHCTATTGSDD